MVPITAIPEREEILAVPLKVKSSKSTNSNASCGEKKKIHELTLKFQSNAGTVSF